MIFLPDTNAFSRYFRGDDRTLVQRFQLEWASVRLSAVVLGELEYGATKSGVPRHRHNVDTLMATVAGIEAWTTDDAAEYGRIRVDLERRGIQIGAYDMQIAAQAIRLGAICVTHNARDFGKVRGLKSEDWQTLA